MTVSMIPGGLPVPPLPFFEVESDATLICPDISAPTSMTGLTQILDIKDFEIDAATNSIKNVSSRSLDMIGKMSAQIQQTGGQPATLVIISERSSDGITWVKNNGSLRENYIVKSGIDYISIPSFVLDAWEDGTYIRFSFSKTGSGGITLSSPIDTVGGDVVNGNSFYWEMEARN